MDYTNDVVLSYNLFDSSKVSVFRKIDEKHIGDIKENNGVFIVHMLNGKRSLDVKTREFAIAFLLEGYKSVRATKITDIKQTSLF